jgi:ADP-ribosylglycohydrolase
MGPSTAAIVAAWREGRDPATVGVIGQSTRKMSSIGNTNGAAMRVAPIGLLHPNDIEGSCAQALVTCLPAHDTDVAISAACVIAAACSVAVGGASLERVIEAAIEGAERGEQLGRRYARRVAGPRLSRRLERALIIATGGLAERPFLEALEEEIGNSVLAAESVPSALAIVLYARADPMRSVALCATAGNDTDSMATMAGAIAGAMAGSSELPPHLLSQFEQANRVHYDLSAMADAMGRLAYGRQI